MHTILGANGVIARGLAHSLAGTVGKLRLVSRNPRKVNPGDETMSADLTNPDAVREAVRGSDVTYITAGLVYDYRIWQEQWPRIMQNAIDACKQSGSRLVFFDNVYAYGKVNGWMTEQTPVNPSSKKGEVRARIARMLMEESDRGNLKALIARAADFYGPGALLTFVHILVFDRLRKGRRAQWLVNDQVRHSFTYTPDAAQATALLGTTDDAFGQVWHLPSASDPLTGREFIARAAAALGRKPRHTVLSPLMLRLAGAFVPFVKENMEMLYQYDSNYLFDSRKFEKRFGYAPTPYDQGIAATAQHTL